MNHSKQLGWILITTLAGLSTSAMAERVVEREIPQMKKAPAVDGDLADWEDIPSIDLGSLSWKSEFDFSGKVKLAWDAENLYVAADIKDQKFVNSNDPASGLYKGDQLRLLMSAFPGRQGGIFAEGDRELFIAPTSATGEPACTFKSGKEAAKVIPQKSGDLEWALVQGKKGYRIECRIPVSMLGIDKFKKGEDALSYVMAVYDRDEPNKDEWSQYHTRLSTSKIKTAPSKWPLVRLAEEVVVLQMP